MIRPLYTGNALSMRGRSPFSGPYQIGIPPGYVAPDRVKVDSAGMVRIQGIPLGSGGTSATEAMVTQNVSEEKQGFSQPIFDAGMYGESQSKAIQIIANTPIRALERAANTRIQLTIQNQNAAGNIVYSFGDAPAVGASIAIAPGGNRLWDSAVPQGDLWLNAAVNSVAVIEFINKNISDVAT